MLSLKWKISPVQEESKLYGLVENPITVFSLQLAVGQDRLEQIIFVSLNKYASFGCHFKH